MKNSPIQIRAKKPQKTTRKSLNSAFSSVHKDAPIDSASYTVDRTPAWEILEDNHDKESTENLLVENENSPSLSASSKALAESDLTPSSAITTERNSEFGVLDGDEEVSELCGSKHGLDEAELVADYLKQARLKMRNSTGMDLRSKKLLDALVEVTVKEFCSLPADERDWMDEVISAKTRILFVCFLMCLVATPVILLMLQFGTRRSAYYYPPPT